MGPDGWRRRAPRMERVTQPGRARPRGRRKGGRSPTPRLPDADPTWAGENKPWVSSPQRWFPGPFASVRGRLGLLGLGCPPVVGSSTSHLIHPGRRRVQARSAGDVRAAASGKHCGAVNGKHPGPICDLRFAICRGCKSVGFSLDLPMSRLGAIANRKSKMSKGLPPGGS